MIPTIAIAILAAACPHAAEIDFRPLPAPNTTAGYKLDIKATTAAGEVYATSIRFSKTAEPEGVAESVAFSLSNRGWRCAQEGPKVTAYGSGGSPVVKIEFVSDVVGVPVVRWVARPEKK